MFDSYSTFSLKDMGARRFFCLPEITAICKVIGSCIGAAATFQMQVFKPFGKFSSR